MKPNIPSVSTFIVWLIVCYWGIVILDFPVAVTGRDLGYTAVLLSILLVDWLNKRYK